MINLYLQYIEDALKVIDSKIRDIETFVLSIKDQVEPEEETVQESDN